MAAERIYYEKEIWDSDSENQSLSKTIQETLLSIGIPPNIYGYAYITYAVELLLKDSEYQHYVTKGLYVDIAQKYRTTPSRVERAIRHAIEVAWTRGKVENMNNIFGYNIYNKLEKPTNGEFIALLAETARLRVRRKMWRNNGC